MTTKRNSIALLGLALLLPPALAQEPAKPDTAQATPRQIIRTDEDGTKTSITATPEEGRWKLELRSEGEGRSAMRALVLPRSPELDKKLDQLFANPPADEDELEDRFEAITGSELDLDDDGDWHLERIPDRVQEQVRRARARVERALEGGFEGFDGRRGPSQDRIHLANGDVVSGELTGMDGGGFRIKTAHGELTIAREEVRQIELRRPPRAVLGIATDDADGGVRVDEVTPDSAAAKAGLKEGDVVTRFAGQPVKSPNELRKLIGAKKPGEQVELSVKRGAETIEVPVTLGSD